MDMVTIKNVQFDFEYYIMNLEYIYNIYNKPSLTTCINYQELLGINKRYINTLKKYTCSQGKG